MSATKSFRKRGRVANTAVHSEDDDDTLTPPPSSPRRSSSPDATPPTKKARLTHSPTRLADSDDNYSAKVSDDDDSAGASSPPSAQARLSKRSKPKHYAALSDEDERKTTTKKHRRLSRLAKPKSVPIGKHDTREDPPLDVVGDGDSPPGDAIERERESTLPRNPTRRKLPPIPKKNKSSIVNTPSANTPVQQPSVSSRTSHSQPHSLPKSSNAGKPRNPNQGTNDVDLRDASVYKNLFGLNKGNSTSKTGPPGALRPSISISAHKEKDATRRAELNKLRDEDRMRRMKESQEASHLYEQHARISRFEARLRARNSSAFSGPNVLAAAFRNWSNKPPTETTPS